MKKQLSILALLSTLLFTSNVYSDGGCCCTDCICPQGPQGSIGTTGIVGPQGGSGLTGSQGPQGPQGSRGPQGPQGIIGNQGEPCCPSNSKGQANVYTTSDLSILPGSSVFFEGANEVTSGSFDVSLAPTTGQITILKAGTYYIGWTIEGQLTPPFPNPVPAWAFSLYLDGIPIPGSCFASFTLFPNEKTRATTGSVMVSVLAGQVLTLQSTSTLPVSIISSIPGSLLPETSASIVIEQRL